MRLVRRAQIVLLAAEGMMNKDIAVELSTAPKTVSLWRTRFADHRLPGIEKDAPRGGRKPTARRRIAKRIIETITPRWLRIAGYWYPRGGIPIDVFWQTGDVPEGVWLPSTGVEPYRGRG